MSWFFDMMLPFRTAAASTVATLLRGLRARDYEGLSYDENTKASARLTADPRCRRNSDGRLQALGNELMGGLEF